MDTPGSYSPDNSDEVDGINLELESINITGSGGGDATENDSRLGQYSPILSSSDSHSGSSSSDSPIPSSPDTDSDPPSPPVGDILNVNPPDSVTPISSEIVTRNAPRRALYDAFHSLTANTSSSRIRIAANLPGLVPSNDPSYHQQPQSQSQPSPSLAQSHASSSQSRAKARGHASAPPTPRRSPPGLSLSRPSNRPTSSAAILQNIIKSIDNYEEIMVRQKIQALNDKNSSCICNVWAKDLYEAFNKIRSLSDRYNYVAMDTEFPGVVCKFPTKAKYTYPNQYQYEYEEIRTNVDSMKLIQLGLTLMDRNGNTPPGICTWQFNFKFNLLTDLYALDSIKMLILAGLNFPKHETDGIEPEEFAYYFITSGLVLTNSSCDPTWITFHSGYDFAYLTRILCGLPMPEDDVKYMQRVRNYFPRAFDVKYLMLSCRELHGGLQDVATRLGVIRQGCQHQAGSDSLLTGRIFFRIREIFFGQNIDENKYNGCLFGFTTSYAGVPPMFEFWRDGLRDYHGHEMIFTTPTIRNLTEGRKKSSSFPSYINQED